MASFSAFTITACVVLASLASLCSAFPCTTHGCWNATCDTTIPKCLCPAGWYGDYCAESCSVGQHYDVLAYDASHTLVWCLNFDGSNSAGPANTAKTFTPVSSWFTNWTTMNIPPAAKYYVMDLQPTFILPSLKSYDLPPTSDGAPDVMLWLPQEGANGGGSYANVFLASGYELLKSGTMLPLLSTVNSGQANLTRTYYSKSRVVWATVDWGGITEPLACTTAQLNAVTKTPGWASIDPSFVGKLSQYWIFRRILCPDLLVMGTTQVMLRKKMSNTIPVTNFLQAWQILKGTTLQDDFLRFYFYDLYLNGEWQGVPFISDLRQIYYNRTTFARIGLRDPPPLKNTNKAAYDSGKFQEWTLPYAVSWSWDTFADYVALLDQDYREQTATVQVELRFTAGMTVDQAYDAIYKICTTLGLDMRNGTARSMNIDRCHLVQTSATSTLDPSSTAGGTYVKIQIDQTSSYDTKPALNYDLPTHSYVIANVAARPSALYQLKQQLTTLAGTVTGLDASWTAGIDKYVVVSSQKGGGWRFRSCWAEEIRLIPAMANNWRGQLVQASTVSQNTTTGSVVSSRYVSGLRNNAALEAGFDNVFHRMFWTDQSADPTFPVNPNNDAFKNWTDGITFPLSSYTETYPPYDSTGVPTLSLGNNDQPPGSWEGNYAVPHAWWSTCWGSDSFWGMIWEASPAIPFERIKRQNLGIALPPGVTTLLGGSVMMMSGGNPASIDIAAAWLADMVDSTDYWIHGIGRAAGSIPPYESAIALAPWNGEDYAVTRELVKIAKPSEYPMPTFKQFDQLESNSPFRVFMAEMMFKKGMTAKLALARLSTAIDRLVAFPCTASDYSSYIVETTPGCPITKYKWNAPKICADGPEAVSLPQVSKVCPCTLAYPENGDRGSCSPLLAANSSCSFTCSSGYTLFPELTKCEQTADPAVSISRVQTCGMNYELEDASKSGVWAIAFIGIAFVVILVIFVFWHRTSRIIYRSSLLYLYAVLVSTLLVFIFILLRAAPATASSCRALPYLISLAVTLLLSVVIVNTHRLTTIFLNYRLKVTVTSSTTLFLRLCALMVPTLTILFVWSGNDEGLNVRDAVRWVNPNNGERTTAPNCDSVNLKAYWGALVAYNLLLLLIVCVLLFRLRTFPNSFTQFNSLAILLSHHLIIAAVIHGVYLSFSNMVQQTWRLFVCGCLLEASLFTLIVVFLPKTQRIISKFRIFHVIRKTQSGRDRADSASESDTHMSSRFDYDPKTKGPLAPIIELLLDKQRQYNDDDGDGASRTGAQSTNDAHSKSSGKSQRRSTKPQEKGNMTMVQLLCAQRAVLHGQQVNALSSLLKEANGFRTMLNTFLEKERKINALNEDIDYRMSTKDQTLAPADHPFFQEQSQSGGALGASTNSSKPVLNTRNSSSNAGALTSGGASHGPVLQTSQGGAAGIAPVDTGAIELQNQQSGPGDKKKVVVHKDDE